MVNFFNSSIGRLRLLALLEGSSLVLLVLVGVPLKRFFDIPEVVKIVGPIHGVLFPLFLLAAIVFSIQNDWRFFKTTWKVLLASFIPFGTFYIDHTILKDIHQAEN